MDGRLIFALILVVALVIAGVVYKRISARKQEEAMYQLADRLHFQFRPDDDDLLPERFAFLKKLHQGQDRYAFNVLAGNYRGHEVLAFDYHFETESPPPGKPRALRHNISCFILMLPRACPELRITAEALLPKIPEGPGADPIQFESAEFTEGFWVWSPHKNFAADVCHPQMIEHLLANRDLSIEIESRALALLCDAPLDPETIEFNLERLVEIRQLMPENLFNKTWI